MIAVRKGYMWYFFIFVMYMPSSMIGVLIKTVKEINITTLLYTEICK